MPKILSYPRGSLGRSIQLAEAVDRLGGACTVEMCAHQMGKKVSGAFTASVSATEKFGLITKERGKLVASALFRDYKLAYSDGERTAALQKAFLSPPLFQMVYDRFRGQSLPIDILDKLLAKEFGLDVKISSKTAGYFVEGARLVELLGPNNEVLDLLGAEGEASTPQDLHADQPENREIRKTDTRNLRDVGDQGTYVVQISGPGMDTSIAISESEDFDILDAMIRKIRRKLEQEEFVTADEDDAETPQHLDTP